MNLYGQCYIDQYNGLWWVRFPDGSKAWDTGYKSRGWAQRTLRQLLEIDRLMQPLYQQKDCNPDEQA